MINKHYHSEGNIRNSAHNNFISFRKEERNISLLHYSTVIFSIVVSLGLLYLRNNKEEHTTLTEAVSYTHLTLPTIYSV